MYEIFKLYYWHDAELVGKCSLPQLAPTQAIPHDVISFNERSGVCHPEKHWVDFFVDDALFEGFWNHPEISFDKLRHFEGIITPDYSMLPEMLPGQQVWNCTRNRVMAFYLQQNGFNIVPAASWCTKDEKDLIRLERHICHIEKTASLINCVFLEIVGLRNSILITENIKAKYHCIFMSILMALEPAVRK